MAGQGSQGQEVCGRPVHLDRHRVVFELVDSQVGVRLSEVLNDFTVLVQGQTLYTGRAVVTNLLGTGLVVLCEASLEEAWFDANLAAPGLEAGQLAGGFDEFLREWQRLYTIGPEFKVMVADLQTFLSELRLWLTQLELRAGAASTQNGQPVAREVLRRLEEPVVSAINALHERFEAVAHAVDKDQWPAHVSFTRRQLHPLFLVSPFAHRSYHKPLGYAGDYEMVNMIMRDPCEGPSLFAQAINVWLLRQHLSEAHRNRIRYLQTKLVEEVLRVSSRGGSARVFSLGCGPAHEIQSFLKESVLSDQAEFTLLDFNEETIAYVRSVLESARGAHGRRARLHFQKKSVVNILKEAVRNEASAAARYDFLYCAGLFDYLPDRTCRQLMAVFYQWLAPGGLLVATNVNQCEPFHMMECLLDWHLIYRTPRQMQALAPAEAPLEQRCAQTDLTGANVFLEVRKPADS